MSEGEVEGWPFWAPSDEASVDAALDLAAVGPGDRVADLGCGDGHVLVRAAQRGAKVVGVETDAELAQQARDALAAAGAAGEVIEGDLFELPLDDLDVIFTYLSPVTLQQLVPRLASAPAGARLVTVDFPVPGLVPERVDGMNHLYRLPARRARRRKPGWPSAGILVAAPPELESLTTLTVVAPGGRIEVVATPALTDSAAVRVGATEADAGTAVAVDLRWTEMAGGTLVTGTLAVEGAGTLDVVALATPDEHGHWDLNRTAVRRLHHFLETAEAPAWAEVLAACD